MSVSDWDSLLPHTVTLYAFSSYDAYGKPSHSSTGTEYSGRVVYKTARVISRTTGQDVLSTVQVWISGTPSLNVDDKLVLPDGTFPKIENWDLFPDEDGSHHVKVFLRG